MTRDITPAGSPATGAVDEAFAEARASFDRFCLAAGIEALGTMMEADVTAACGPRHGRDAARRAHRWGRTRGRIGFHGGKIEVERPRVRGLDGREVTIPSWETAAEEDWLGRWAMNLMLINVSTRRFGRAVRLTSKPPIRPVPVVALGIPPAPADACCLHRRPRSTSWLPICPRSTFWWSTERLPKEHHAATRRVLMLRACGSGSAGSRRPTINNLGTVGASPRDHQVVQQGLQPFAAFSVAPSRRPARDRRRDDPSISASRAAPTAPQTFARPPSTARKRCRRRSAAPSVHRREHDGHHSPRHAQRQTLAGCRHGLAMGRGRHDRGQQGLPTIEGA